MKDNWKEINDEFDSLMQQIKCVGINKLDDCALLSVIKTSFKCCERLYEVANYHLLAKFTYHLSDLLQEVVWNRSHLINAGKKADLMSYYAKLNTAIGQYNEWEYEYYG